MSTCWNPLDALTSLNPASWLTSFGPGAIIASLTIGSGELIFSSRGGALFGYQLLSLFFLVCVFKWALVFATARPKVATVAKTCEPDAAGCGFPNSLSHCGRGTDHPKRGVPVPPRPSRPFRSDPRLVKRVDPPAV